MDPFALNIEALQARRGTKWRHYPDDVLPAWVADMDFAVPEPVQRAIERVVHDQDYGYFWRPAEDTLAAAFAAYMVSRYAWRLDPELVLPITDLVQAMVATIMVYSEPGDGVVVQTPLYPPFLSSIKVTERRRVENELRDDGTRFVVDVDGLRSVVDQTTRIIMVCNPHNPTGRVFERSELEAIGSLAVERDLVIVCDEIHADLVYPGHEHVPMGTLAPEIASRTITLSSATKGFNIAGLKCALIHFGSTDLRERFERRFPGRLLGQPSSVGLDATVAAWRDGQPWLDQVLRRLQCNRDRLFEWVRTEVPAIHHHRPEGTYLAWLDCRDVKLPAATPFDFFLDEARVALNNGGHFGPPGDTCVRLNFATSGEILEQVLDRMGKALRSVSIS